MHFNARNRDEFLAAAYQGGQDHFDRTAAIHDDRFGSIEETHARCLAAFIAQVNPGETILDVACGTGKYFESLAALGHAVFGVDYSAKMLEQARRKAPHVTTCHCALQDLRHAHALHERFGG